VTTQIHPPAPARSRPFAAVDERDRKPEEDQDDARGEREYAGQVAP
jgi:hypothetical protein